MKQHGISFSLNKSHIVNSTKAMVAFMIILCPILGKANTESGDLSLSKNKKNKSPKYEKFQMKLNIEHGHIGHVFIGCQKGATDDFDTRIDDMAPPPGMGGVGYTFLVSPDKKYNLYRDIRGFSETVQWVFYAKPGTKPVRVWWHPESVPQGWNMHVSPGDGKSEKVAHSYDCRQKTSVETDKTGFFRFWIERQDIVKSKTP